MIDRPIVIAASILDADAADLGGAVAALERAGADRVHVDVMDGHFVPDLTFGPRTIRALRRRTALPIDAHLMIDDPARHIDDYLEAGADSITIHVEVTDPIVPILAAIRTAGRAAGLSLRPATDLASLDPYRDALDIVMVMTVEPGRGGQAFMDDVAAERIPAARDRLADPVGRGEVHVDGGVNGRTAVAAGSHGADVLVVGSALFGPGTDLAAEIARVRSAAEAARRHDARS